MINFVHNKKLNILTFSKYLESAEQTNQYTNYGKAVQQLENRARSMLKIDQSKAIIAVCNGASALNAIIRSISVENTVYSQDFTFPCNFQIPDVQTKAFDMTDNWEPDIEQVIYPSIVIITNCFGHVVDIDKILKVAEKHKHKIVFDNAASPYSFYKGSNISNYGIASYISLHHTKPIGFGEGGLIVIDKMYEDTVRAIINFGMVNRKPILKGSNYKMSELSAAGILQWWDSFEIEELKAKYLQAYNKYVPVVDKMLPNYSNDFFPNCLPVIKSTYNFEGMDIRKYYHPSIGLTNSTRLYDKIKCIPITEFLND